MTEINYKEYKIESLERTQKEIKEIIDKRNIIKCGQRYKEHCGTKYILAQCDKKKIVLISLKDGNRWTDPILVKFNNNITKDEFKKICGSGNFIKVDDE